MAKGRKPVPLAILKLRGSWRAKGREDTEIRMSGKPRMPQWLSPAAKQAWKRNVPLLSDLGIILPVDELMLALLCTAFAEWKEADALVGSLLVKTSKGTLIQHPVVSIRNAAFERLRKMAAEFGMSPSARTGLLLTPKKNKSSKSRFFVPRNRADDESA